MKRLPKLGENAISESRLLRRCRFEEMESRRMLDANPLLLGAVYTEQDQGADTQRDTIEITFAGGNDQAEVTRIVIDGDQVENFGNLPGFSSGDVFFDTETGGLGVDGALSLQSELTSAGGGATNAVITNIELLDGTSTLIVDLENFNAGDRLTLHVDVDEAEVFNPNDTDLDVINSRFDPIASGAEFAGSFITAHIRAPHFQDEVGAAMFVNAYDSVFDRTTSLGLTLDLPGDDENLNRDRTAGALVEIQQDPIPVTISGRVFYDRDADLQLEPGEFDRGIDDVTLELWRHDGNNYQPVTHNGVAVTVQTDTTGRYQFDASWNLTPGDYQIREQQPNDYVSVAAIAGNISGAVAGSALSVDVLTNIVIPHGGNHSAENNFVETRPASVSGSVFHDRDNDGEIDSGEEAIAEVVVQLFDANGSLVGATETNTAGAYRFDGLTPGTYSVRETQPTGWMDGKDSRGQVDRLGVGVIDVGQAGNDRFDAIELRAEESGENYDFGERLGRISGRVFSDRNGNCVFEQHEIGIAGVEMTLIDEAGNTLSTLTDANGEYAFDDLKVGVYSVVQSQPEDYFHGGQKIGNGGGDDSQANRIDSIFLGVGDIVLTNYDFCEQLGSLSGNVYHDVNNDGLMSGAGEHGIDGVAIQLFLNGQFLADTTTDGQGAYQFSDLSPGRYELRETQPLVWFDGRDTAGRVAGATVGQATDDRIEQIDLTLVDDATAALHGVDYNFGERLGQLSGYVYADADNDGLREPSSGEHGIADVEIQLTHPDGTVETALTNANGFYQFVGLTPGAYAVDEIQPSDWFDGRDTVGTVNGLNVGAAADDRIEAIQLQPSSGADLNAVEYNFGERLGSLSGNVYHDRNDDGVWNSGEEAIPGVQVELRDGAGGLWIASTDSAGRYQFSNIRPGEYSLQEVQPQAWIDGKETLGQVAYGAAGVVAADRFSGVQLASGPGDIVGEQFNFGERKGSISGVVHTDINGNCQMDGSEQPLAGVVVHLLGERGNLIATTETDSAGQYEFSDIGPGEYFVVERQPDGFFHGGQVVGSHGGDARFEDVLGELFVGDDAVHLTEYNFCEAPPSTLSGYVFQDGPPIETADGQPPENIRHFRDGVFTADDTPIAGVVLELRNGLTGEPIHASTALPGVYGVGPIRTTTDADGFYEFVGIRGGASYAVYQVQPADFHDGIDTAGTTSGLAINPSDNINPLALSQLTENPNGDAIIRIPLAVGASSEQNNFSEILVTTSPPPPPPPNPPEPPRRYPEPPSPEVLPIFFTPQPPTKTDIPVFVTGGAVEMTWHLSIINAGAPRGRLPEDGGAHATWADVSHNRAAQWRADAMRGAIWARQDPRDPQLEYGEVIFGAPNAIPVAGDFNGDGVSEIGVFIDGHWYLDLDGDGVWSERDLWAKLGEKHDLPVVGDWDGDGKDDIGIFGPMWEGDPVALKHEQGVPDVANRWAVRPKNVPPIPQEATTGERLLQKTERGRVRSDLIDHVFRLGVEGDRPFAGDFNGDGVSTIGVFSAGQWKIDSNGDGRWRADDDKLVEFGQAGDTPLVVDFDGNGVDELSVIRNGRWIIDSDGDRELTVHDRVFELEGRGTPVVGDWNGDGREEVGFVNNLGRSDL